MYGIIFEYRTGRLIEAVVLRLTDNGMRVIPRDWRDAVELRCMGAEWIDEGGEAVALAFLAAVGDDSQVHPLLRQAS